MTAFSPDAPVAFISTPGRGIRFVDRRNGPPAPQLLLQALRDVAKAVLHHAVLEPASSPPATAQRAVTAFRGRLLLEKGAISDSS
mmetsp:Transcript_26755/g.27112  ORF Transcript_26755/g.27112 Transcript_26755/m.27112 type:complete len:85 (-) Transcript_26755:458-712(-)